MPTYERLKLSDRDKAAIQSVTRYGLSGGYRYCFESRHGRIHFRMPGTTSHAEFQEYADVEQYIAELAAFAVVRLARKKEERYGLCLLSEKVLVNDKNGRTHSLNLWNLIREYTGETRASLLEASKKRRRRVS